MRCGEGEAEIEAKEGGNDAGREWYRAMDGAWREKQVSNTNSTYQVELYK